MYSYFGYFADWYVDASYSVGGTWAAVEFPAGYAYPILPGTEEWKKTTAPGSNTLIRAPLAYLVWKDERM